METGKDGSKLEANHIRILITIERIGSGLSMVAVVLTVISYIAFKRLRTTPNLFLVFASIANAGASCAAMMGYDGLRVGVKSAICQAQGFLFQWFIQADPWWSCAMAINVFLVFFNNANPATFQKYTWVYCIVCFGGPMIPAVVLVSIKDDAKGPVIADADSFSRRNEWYGLAVTEVRVTSGLPCSDSEEAIASSATTSRPLSQVRCLSWGDAQNDIGSELRALPPQHFETTCSSSGGRRSNKLTLAEKFSMLRSTALSRLDPVKMAYLRTSFIFGVSVLITWIPSSVNRLYSFANDGDVNYSLSIASGCVIPLQGVWNAVIFFTTSWSSVRAEVKILKARLGFGRCEHPRGSTRLGSNLGMSSVETNGVCAESPHEGRK
ncbi:hypothetical protein QQS21_001179 [Conoideocrella luteorostrata]|uniref:G-protein coupled receptors family 2 profile 2 domain-containing protein n=1 Tax=Conoideocrella luteorostrata TaxID=1105319 RepID=A0AAJ0D0A0_9HYPO|nr:hypothetical protein QQS21_001179 [Conoideocrella luteorostrata]